MSEFYSFLPPETLSPIKKELLLNPFESAFEQYVSASQEKLRGEHLQKLQELLEGNSNFNEQQLREIITQAKCLWSLLNPGLKTQWGDWSQHPIRFKSKQKINPNFVENNWEHSVAMIETFYELKKIAPNVMATLNEEEIIKTIINHDCGEIVKGDVESKDQIGEKSKEEKQEQEKEAFLFIRDHVSGIDDPYILHRNYENRHNINSYVTKALDQRSGDTSFYKNIVLWIHSQPNAQDIYLQHQKELDGNYEPNENNRIRNYESLFGQLDQHLKGLDSQIDDEELERFRGFFVDAPVQKADSFGGLSTFSELELW